MQVTDHNDGEQQFFGFPVPAEMMADMRARQARIEMHYISASHQIASLYEELSKDHLLALRMMLSGISNASSDGEARRLAAYSEGVAAATLTQRFDVCSGCGENHDEPFLKEAGIGDEPKMEPSAPASMGADQMTLFDMRPEVHADLQPGDLEKMREYNIDDLRDESTLRLLGFVCLGCGQQYPSIEDRAKRPAGVEGCSGCQQKAAWG